MVVSVLVFWRHVGGRATCLVWGCNTAVGVLVQRKWREDVVAGVEPQLFGKERKKEVEKFGLEIFSISSNQDSATDSSHSKDIIPGGWYGSIFFLFYYSVFFCAIENVGLRLCQRLLWATPTTASGLRTTLESTHQDLDRWFVVGACQTCKHEYLSNC